MYGTNSGMRNLVLQPYDDKAYTPNFYRLQPLLSAALMVACTRPYAPRYLRERGYSYYKYQTR